MPLVIPNLTPNWDRQVQPSNLGPGPSWYETSPIFYLGGPGTGGPYDPFSNTEAVAPPPRRSPPGVSPGWINMDAPLYDLALQAFGQPSSRSGAPTEPVSTGSLPGGPKPWQDFWDLHPGFNMATYG